MVGAADGVLDAVLVNGGVGADAQAPGHMAVVLAIEDCDGSEDRDVAEHPGPPQVPATGAVRHTEERQEVVDESDHPRTVSANGRRPDDGTGPLGSSARGGPCRRGSSGATARGW